MYTLKNNHLELEKKPPENEKKVTNCDEKDSPLLFCFHFEGSRFHGFFSQNQREFSQKSAWFAETWVANSGFVLSINLVEK